MPIPSEKSVKMESLHFVVENLPYLKSISQELRQSRKSSDSDITFSSSSDDEDAAKKRLHQHHMLNDLLQDYRLQELVRVYEAFDAMSSGTIQSTEEQQDGRRVMAEVILQLNNLHNVPEAQELLSILCQFHMLSLMDTFDSVCHQQYEPSLPAVSTQDGTVTSFTSTRSTTSLTTNSSDGSSSIGSVAPPHQQRVIVEARTQVQVRSQMHSANPKQKDEYMPRIISPMQAAPPKSVLSSAQQVTNTTLPPRNHNVTKVNTSQSSHSIYSMVQRDRTPKVVRIEKHPREPLGLTVTRQDSFINSQMHSEIVVERIIADSVIHKQDILHVGDVILTINDTPVETTDSLQRILRNLALPVFTMKIIPAPLAYFNTLCAKDPYKTYVRTFFAYDPKKDTLLPTASVGVKFDAGEILEVVNKSDPHYWQARRLDNPRVGLIPSVTLEERRKAYNGADHNKVQSSELMREVKMGTMVFPCSQSKGIKCNKKSKKLFSVIDAPIFSEVTDIWSYEEVVQVPPMRLRCLALMGPTGVGKRSLKHLICEAEPRRFAFPIPDTSERSVLTQPQSACRYMERGQMESDIKKGLYLEWAEVQGQLIGIRLQALRDVITMGKTVVLDVQPTSVRTLCQAEFNPHVVFVAAPSVDVLRSMQLKGLSKGISMTKRTDEDFRLIVEQSAQYERLYRHLYQCVILNDNMESSVQRLVGMVRRLERHPQWIRVAWEEELAPNHRLSVVAGEVESRMDDLESVASGFTPSLQGRQSETPSGRHTSSTVPGRTGGPPPSSVSYSSNSSQRMLQSRGAVTESQGQIVLAPALQSEAQPLQQLVYRSTTNSSNSTPSSHPRRVPPVTAAAADSSSEDTSSDSETSSGSTFHGNEDEGYGRRAL